MHSITISTRWLSIGLFAAAALELGLCYVHAAHAMINGTALADVPAPWLNIDGEAALNAWFTASLLLITALLMLWAFTAERQAGTRTAFGWLLLSVGFAYLSLDEMTSIHEGLASLTTGFTLNWPIFTHRWVIIGIPVVLGVALVFLPFLSRLPRRTALRLLVAGAVYVGGALGLELLNGSVRAAQGMSFSYLLLMCIEETLEVIGVLLAIRTVALHIATELGAPTLRLSSATP